MYAFTVGFKEGESTPTLLYGPNTSVEKQDGDLDRAALIDDGGGYVTVEIVYSNGRPKRRVDFTTPAQKAARIAREAAAQAKKEAAAQEQNKARIAALKTELAELESGEPGQVASASLPEVDPAAYSPEAVALDTALVSREAAAIEADDEAAATEAAADPAPTVSPEAAALDADDEAAAAEAVADPAPVSGKRKR